MLKKKHVPILLYFYTHYAIAKFKKYRNLEKQGFFILFMNIYYIIHAFLHIQIYIF